MQLSANELIFSHLRSAPNQLHHNLIERLHLSCDEDPKPLTL